MRASGFTLIEILISLAMAGVLLALGSLSFATIRNVVAAENDAQGVVTVLRQAQRQAQVSAANLPHGVRIGTVSYTAFAGDWNATPVIAHNYPLTTGFAFGSGADTTISFARLTGETAAATITITRDGAVVRTILVDAHGAITITH